MKSPLTRYYCMSKECDYEETNHKLLEGTNCPKCKGPVMSQRVKKDKSATGTININNIFALSNWTLSEGRFFTSLQVAVDASNEFESTNDVAIIEMELQGNEFVEVKRYESNGELIETDEEGAIKNESTDSHNS
ncbi:hypothetical protein [Lysinibacillus sp. Ag94]|uniref:hypothetical protein n=1 Tax=Lysinibacillus sp. Ag94 TaxID=2936682 RepID=UPI00200D99E4|nr:hypothetical protein [Lysinibacillus sp. Ag94]UPW82739.1 hypothetical protein MY533_18790 [Lysinibacillus sp. Ag94]